MEEEKQVKTKKSHGAVWFILFLILVIAGLVCYILIDDGVIDVPNITKTEKVNNSGSKKNGSKTDKGTELDITNGSVVELYKMAHLDTYGSDQMVFNNKKLTFEDMDDDYRFRLASRYFPKVHVDSENESIRYLTEDEVKAAFEKVFGPKTYKKVNKFATICPIYEYNEGNSRYQYTSEGGCGGAAGMWEVEEILTATKYDNRIEIVSGVVYYRGNNGEDAVYKDYNRKTKLIDVMTGNDTDTRDTKIKEYLLSHRDDIEQYTYTYELNDDGFYYYKGVERTQE